MDVLGYSQITMTMDTYAHVTPALQREPAEHRMERLLTGSGQAHSHLGMGTERYRCQRCCQRNDEGRAVIPLGPLWWLYA